MAVEVSVPQATQPEEPTSSAGWTFEARDDRVFLDRSRYLPGGHSPTRTPQEVVRSGPPR
jgi:hypothetical protein